ncbi:MAG: aromatic-ring-hydroxylating dioxygenase subunit beta [Gammaproteobacteria bacterium]
MNQPDDFQLPTLPAETEPSSDAVFLSLQRQLHLEARLLDELDHKQWLNLLTHDVCYFAPVFGRRLRNEQKTSDRLGGYVFNDRRIHLEMRVTRLDSNMVWCEDPVNHVRHLVSNIEVFDTDDADEVKVYSAVDLHRSRLDSKLKRLTYGRTDIWRQQDGRWLLAMRCVNFDHNATIDSNLNLFF